jgi:hypothetical protein
VLCNREQYAGFYILAVIEMLKYAVKEDYDNAKTEIQIMSCQLEYCKPSQTVKRDLKNANFKNLQKRMYNRKKEARKGKHQNQTRYEDSSSQSEQEEEEISDTEVSGSFYLRFKDAIPPIVKKDMMVEDLWLLMKRPLVTNQNLSDVSDMILAKSQWHYHNKQQKMKVSIVGDAEAVKLKADQYKFAFKSVNLSGFSSLIENLIQFRERSNPYVDSMLGIANSKSKFKVIKKCDPLLVEAVRRATCLRFRLNHD